MDLKPQPSGRAAAMGSPAAMIGVMLVACTVVGLGLGLLVDRWAGTRPGGMLVGLLLGIVAGFLNIFRTVSSRRTSYDVPGDDPGLVRRRGGSPEPPVVKGEGT